MTPQHLADRSSGDAVFEAFEPQPRSNASYGCIFDPMSDKIGIGCTQATITSKRRQAGLQGTVGSFVSDRSKRCPRASSFLPRLAWLLQLLHVPSQHRKSSSLSILNRFRLSQSTPANTNNQLLGRALGSVPTHALSRVLLLQEGRAC